MICYRLNISKFNFFLYLCLTANPNLGNRSTFPTRGAFYAYACAYISIRAWSSSVCCYTLWFGAFYMRPNAVCYACTTVAEEGITISKLKLATSNPLLIPLSLKGAAYWYFKYKFTCWLEQLFLVFLIFYMLLLTII